MSISFWESLVEEKLIGLEDRLRAVGQAQAKLDSRADALFELHVHAMEHLTRIAQAVELKERISAEDNFVEWDPNAGISYDEDEPESLEFEVEEEWREDQDFLVLTFPLFMAKQMYQHLGRHIRASQESFTATLPVRRVG